MNRSLTLLLRNFLWILQKLKFRVLQNFGETRENTETTMFPASLVLWSIVALTRINFKQLAVSFR